MYVGSLAAFSLIAWLSPPRAHAISQIIDATGDGVHPLTDADAVVVDATGAVYVEGVQSDNVFKIEPGGMITEIISAADGLDTPQGLAVDASLNVYVAGFDSNNAFRIPPGGPAEEIIDATGDGSNFLTLADAIAVDAVGAAYVAARATDNVFRIPPAGPPVLIIDGSGDGTNQLFGPNALAIDAAGNLYVSGESSDNVFKMEPGGTITEIVNAADGLNTPFGLALDAAGNLYVAGAGSNNVLKVEPGGAITEILDSTGDGTHSFGSPLALAADAAGNVFVPGATHDNAFRIPPGGSPVQIIDASGDGVHALDLPVGITVASGVVYVSGLESHNVFRIPPPSPDIEGFWRLASECTQTNGAVQLVSAVVELGPIDGEAVDGAILPTSLSFVDTALPGDPVFVSVGAAPILSGTYVDATLHLDPLEFTISVEPTHPFCGDSWSSGVNTYEPMSVADENGDGRADEITGSSSIPSPECGAPITCENTFSRTDAVTLAGQDVIVSPAPGVVVDFGVVDEGGNTYAFTIPGTIAGPPPTFTLLDPPILYDVGTSATVTGPVVVCLPYPDADGDGFVDGTDPPIDELLLAVLHNEGGTFVDRTSSHDPMANSVCATVNGFSELALAASPTPAPVPATSRSQFWALLAIMLTVAVTWLRRRAQR